MSKLPWHSVKFPDNSLTLRHFISPWHFPDGYEPCWHNQVCCLHWLNFGPSFFQQRHSPWGPWRLSLPVSGSLRPMLSLIISSSIDLGSSTGTSSVLPRCWLYCSAQASVNPLVGTHHFLMDPPLRRSHTPSSLWIWRNSRSYEILTH